MTETSSGGESAGGPPVRLKLPDGQELQAVLLRRRQADDGSWWYLVAIPLWGPEQRPDGTLVAALEPVECWAPAKACTPAPGEDYDQVPIDRPRRRPPWWLLEDAGGEQLVVHRGDCAAVGLESEARPAGEDQVRAAAQAGAVPCELCRPDRALG
ncbi:hypothetical protein E1265_35715 [Streptomyces sp. 8K308]|uniref:DUF6233 domain-containing protein n=1 Tax=Streptomyces sp. 8K308 TaxID=2530388 RepID=UPI001050A214|nr:DUF6233 domain-containing protein [Streptomyces sp. 8K308]TDC04915.1 hypothetical protein E1265_35715 [Streptomyces sp. 8K308]